MVKYHDPCPLCGQPMDFAALTYRAHAFIDGKRYDAMCFTCAQVPEDHVQTTKDGTTQQAGPYYDHKHLRSADTLLNIGAATTLSEAKHSVRAVRQAIQKTGSPKLNKLHLTQPKAHYLYLDDPKEAAARAALEEAAAKKKTKKKPKKKPIVD